MSDIDKMQAVIKDIEFEYDGIDGNIKKYSSESSINNYLNKLKEGLEKNDFEIVKKSINSICLWYDANIQKILSNTLVFNEDTYSKNYDMLKKFNDTLNQIDISSIQNQKEKNINTLDINNQYSEGKHQKIFISHKSSDKKYGDALASVLRSIGLKNNQIVYTSHMLHKIPIDNNIMEYLKNNIREKIYVVFIFSEEYFNSSICLNEMGAFWISQSGYTNAFVPEFDFDSKKFKNCVIDCDKIGLTFDSSEQSISNLTEFISNVTNLFDLDTLSPTEMLSIQEEFKKAVS